MLSELTQRECEDCEQCTALPEQAEEEVPEKEQPEVEGKWRSIGLWTGGRQCFKEGVE